MEGYLLIDKPAGISSFGVVAKVKRLIREGTGRKIKVGHTGTLDPAATGLMILVIGGYTKRAGSFSKLDKLYEAQLTLGSTSSTADREGTITPFSDKEPTLEEVKSALKQFKGQLQQTPPVYSAVKIGGQRAYKLARAGKAFQTQPRTVIISSISNVRYSYPQLSFQVRVSSGTYIRSLAEDIGQVLGTGAYLSALRRLEVGDLSVLETLKLDNIIFHDIVKNVKQIPPKE